MGVGVMGIKRVDHVIKCEVCHRRAALFEGPTQFCEMWSNMCKPCSKRMSTPALLAKGNTFEYVDISDEVEGLK